MSKKYHAHRVGTNIYEYRGFQIECAGYYPPEHIVVSEAVDHDGSGFAHVFPWDLRKPQGRLLLLSERYVYTWANLWQLL